MTGREVLLQAFDHLFDKAAAKLRIDCDAAERAAARQHFAERFSTALDFVGQLSITAIPDEVMRAMEDAIEELSPAQVAGHLAAIPLMHQTQELLRTIATRNAQQRLLEHLINQADDTYGGN